MSGNNKWLNSYSGTDLPRQFPGSVLLRRVFWANRTRPSLVQKQRRPSFLDQRMEMCKLSSRVPAVHDRPRAGLRRGPRSREAGAAEGLRLQTSAPLAPQQTATAAILSWGVPWGTSAHGGPAEGPCSRFPPKLWSARCTLSARETRLRIERKGQTLSSYSDYTFYFSGIVNRLCRWRYDVM